MSVFRLKDVLKERGMTGKELAERVNVTEASISNLVKGDSIPRKDLLLKIAGCLNVDIRELFISTKGLSKLDLIRDIKEKLELLEEKF